MGRILAARGSTGPLVSHRDGTYRVNADTRTDRQADGQTDGHVDRREHTNFQRGVSRIER